MKDEDQQPVQAPKSAETESEADRFRDFVKQVVSVPKEEIDKRQAEYEKKKAAKKRKHAKA